MDQMTEGDLYPDNPTENSTFPLTFCFLIQQEAHFSHH